MSGPLTCTVAEAAELLGIGRRLAYEQVRRGEFPLPTVRVGRRVLVGRAALEERLAAGPGDRLAGLEARLAALEEEVRGGKASTARRSLPRVRRARVVRG